MSFASQASLNSRTIAALRARDGSGSRAARTRRRADDASCRHAAGVRPRTSATSPNG